MRQRPICIGDFIAVDKRGNPSAKDVIGDKKKMRRTQEKFLGAMQERVPHSINLHVGAGES